MKSEPRSESPDAILRRVEGETTSWVSGSISALFGENSEETDRAAIWGRRFGRLLGFGVAIACIVSLVLSLR